MYDHWRDPDYQNYIRGNALQAQGRYREALTIFDDILRELPSSKQTWIGQMMTDRIFALAGLHLLDEMVTAVDELVARFGDTKDSDLQVYVAQALYNKGAKFLHDPAPAKSLAAFDDILARFGDGTAPAMQQWIARAQYYRGTQLSAIGRYQGALEQFDRYATKYAYVFKGATADPLRSTIPNVRIALLGRAKALAAQGRRTEAETAFRELEAQSRENFSEPGAVAVVALAQIERARLMDRATDAIAVYDGLIAEFVSTDHPDVAETVALAMREKATLEAAGGKK